jgi:3-dehydroquinate synthase
MAAVKVVVQIPGETDYGVRIGEGILDGLGQTLRQIEAVATCPHVLVISDSNVAPLYLARTKAALAGAGFKVSDICVPAGEESKSVEVAGEVWEAMAALGLTRDCTVVALGGGVVGDLAGFTGSTFMRGITVVQVPTTLLAMVDSSVGGKTGVNLEAGKNLVGTFCQPAHVCASTDTLATLDAREWACGLAEVAKSAVIDSDEFFFWMYENAQGLAARNWDLVQQAIARCVVFKAGVVSEDKTESHGVRECLNYGHTLAHAIEKLSGYGKYSHGAAVAEGMRFAAVLGARIVGTNAEFAQTQAQLLDTLGLLRLDFRAPAQDILEVMKHDKKARAGAVKFVLARDVAKWELVQVSDADILMALEEFYA